MESLVWHEELSLGVTLLDEQHKELFHLINKLIENPEAKTTSEPIADILDKLTHYAQVHFKTEENYMSKCRYPHMERHIEQHRLFKKKIAEFCFAASEGFSEVPESLLEYLKEWLTNHILEEDLALIPYFDE